MTLEINTLHNAKLFDCTGHDVIDGIFRLADRCLSGDFNGKGVSCIDTFKKIVSKHMLQKEMEAVAMVMVAEMTKFMEKHIVLKHLREAHDVQVKVYVAL